MCRGCNTCRNYGEFCWKKLIVKNPLLKPGVDVRMILKWIVKMEDGRYRVDSFSVYWPVCVNAALNAGG
jgi:hypothetical protein